MAREVEEFNKEYEGFALKRLFKCFKTTECFQ